MKTIDFELFSDHDKPNEGLNEWPEGGKTIPLNPVGSQIGSSWKPE